MRKDVSILILAAGKGSRMNSAHPKVLHQLHDKTLLEHVMSNAAEVTNDIQIVCNDVIISRIAALPEYKGYNLILQDTQLGTGHAVKVALPSLNNKQNVVILYGDNPLIKSRFILEMVQELNAGVDLVNLVFNATDPKQYGRVIVDEKNNIIKIVEYKDASNTERLITLCNSGVMAFKNDVLQEFIPLLNNNNAKGEYYLTDMVALAKARGKQVTSIIIPEKYALGVNTQDELALVDDALKNIL